MNNMITQNTTFIGNKSVQNEFYSNHNRKNTNNYIKEEKNDTVNANNLEILEELKMHHESVETYKKMLAKKNKTITNAEINLKLGEHLEIMNKQLSSTKCFIASLNLEFSEQAYIGLIRNATIIYNKTKDDYLLKRCEMYSKNIELKNEKTKYYHNHLFSLINKNTESEKGFKEILRKNKETPNYEDNKLYQSLTGENKRSKNIKQKSMPTIITKSGHYVRSKAEKIIADYYYDNNIRFRYEPYLELDYEMHPDFYLEDYDVYHEHFGITNNEKYQETCAKKLKQYKKHDKIVIVTTSEDEADIGRILNKKMNDLKKK